VKLSYLGLVATLALGGCSTVSAPDLMSHSSAAIRGTGYASVTGQPGRTASQKQLMAIRAARMAAMRELAEKIHGLDVDGYISVNEAVLQNDTVRGTVNGLVRGARLVSVTPVKTDVYEVVLEVEPSDVEALRAQARPQRYR
jgi:outer membrane protein FlgP